MKFIGLQRIYDVIDGTHARIFTDDEMMDENFPMDVPVTCEC